MYKTFILSIITILAAFLFNFSADAQSWNWATGSRGLSDFDGYYCTTDFTGNVYVTGVATGSAIFGPDSFYAAACVMAKYDNSGNLKWAINGPVTQVGLVADAFGYEYLMGTSSVSFTMGGKGFTKPSGIGRECYFIVKVDSSGNVIWIKNIGNMDGTSPSVNSKLLAIDKGGNLYVTCAYDNTPTVGSYTLANPGGVYQAAVVKLDSACNILWAKGFTGPRVSWPSGIAVSPSGSIYITGSFQSDTLLFGTHAVYDTIAPVFVTYIAKLDAGGNAVWATTIGGSKALQDGATAIAADDANVYIAGYYRSATITFGSFTLPYTGAYTGFLTQYDSSGNAVWAKAMKVPFAAGYPIYSLALDPCHNIWLSGGYGDPSGIDSLDGHVLVCPPGSFDPMIVAGWSSGGTLLQCTALISGGEDFIDIAIDRFGKIFVESDYAVDTMVVGNDTLIGNKGAHVYEHNFVGCYNPNICESEHAGPTQAENIQQPAASLQLYPNPATSELVAVYNENIKEIAVQNITGKTVFAHTYDMPGKQVGVNVANLPAGMYFIKVNNLSIGKFLKE